MRSSIPIPRPLAAATAVRPHVPCRLEVSEGMWHVFQMFPIKKAAAAMESAARFLLEL